MTMPAHFTIGADPPASRSTLGYRLNHTALVVYDAPAMRQFYGDVLGMRHIMTCQVSAAYQITYLGYPVGGEEFQTGQALHDGIRRREGLLEFLHASDVCQAQRSESIGRFSHLGFVVPDLRAAQKRMVELGVPILKEVGDMTLESNSSIVDWWGIRHMQVPVPESGLKAVGWGEVLLVRDPDGNIVELQERH